MEKKHHAPAAAATIDIIEAIADEKRALTLTEISIASRLNKNMVSRALHDLAEAGWVIADQCTGKYSLSLQLFRLGSAALEEKTPLKCADKYLRELNDLTGECVQMAVPNGDRALYVMQYESKKPAGIRGRIGESYPMDTSAPGKALKAFFMLDPDMEQTRKNGYAEDNEEYGRGIVCIAAPVFDYTGKAVAAVGISSLTINNDLEQLKREHLADLLSVTRRFSRELGHDVCPTE